MTVQTFWGGISWIAFMLLALLPYALLYGAAELTYEATSSLPHTLCVFCGGMTLIFTSWETWIDSVAQTVASAIGLLID